MNPIQQAFTKTTTAAYQNQSSDIQQGKSRDQKREYGQSQFDHRDPDHLVDH